jgi:DNA-binding MarR family transcriptional regulator
MPERPDFDLTEFVPYLLNQAAEEASLAFQRVYKDRYGMLRTEWRVLFHLGRYGAMTATEVGRRAKVHKTKISRAVRALEARRFLRREGLEGDRRAEMLSLTAAGRAAFDDLGAIADRHNRDLLARLRPEDREGFARSLKVLARLPAK